MSILFITSSRIGDAVLSTGVLNYCLQKYPNADVTVGCGPLAVSLFEGCPNVARIIPIHKQKYNKHWLAFWEKIARQKFDIVIDLRNTVISSFVRSKERYILSAYVDKTRHKVEQNASVMRLSSAPSPILWFSEDQKKRADSLITNGGPVIGVGPAANWSGKTWPVERFIEIIKWMTDSNSVMPYARVAVFAAPGEEEVAYKMLSSIPNDKGIDVIAKTDPGTAAATISKCDFYIGNDSGLMHCAAAAGIQTLGLFGPSYPNIYRPWGEHASYVSTPENFDELIDFKGYDSSTVGTLMNSLTVEAVKNSISDMFSKKYAGLQKRA